MSGRTDLTNQTFGLLTVLELSDIKKSGKRAWRCRCSCCGDEEVYALTFDLKKETRKRCKGQSLPPHIERQRKTIEEWVKVAEVLAKDNDGVLPIKEKRPSGLTKCMYNNKDAFSHIPKEKFYTTKDEWIDIANQLANDNGGKLPSHKWLCKHGYRKLTYQLNDNPDSFSHIERDREHSIPNTTDEWVEIGNGLAEDNGGSLPPIQWLRKNGYIQLTNQKRKYPEKFQHLKYERHKGCRLTIEEMVEQAEDISNRNGGILPSKDWLNDHGYHGLKVALYKQPEHFTHIRRAGDSRKSPEEWLEVAKELVKEYNGILPSMANVRRMGYDGLMGAIALHPEVFKDIPRHPQKSINLNEPGYFYFIIFEYKSRKLIKVGISRDVEGRHHAFMLANGIRSILYKEAYYFEPARGAHKLEQNILRVFSEDRVYPGDGFDGRTECFRIGAWEGILEYVDEYREQFH